MNRSEFTRWALTHLEATEDFPWTQYPTYSVLRHPESLKWFAVLMTVSADKVGIGGGFDLDIVNLRLPSETVTNLLEKPGFSPAYHMNKKLWISVILDSDDVPEEQLKKLSQESFQLTQIPPKKTRKPSKKTH